MPFLSDFHENKIGDHMYRNQAYTTPTTIYVSLHSAIPGETGTSEISGGPGPYARQALTLGAFASGASDNTGVIEFTGLPAVTGDGLVGFGIWDALTTGNLLSWGLLQPSGGFKKLFVVEAANLAGNDITSPSHGLVNDDRVAFVSIAQSTLPTGISASTLYWVTGTPNTDDFAISTTQDGGEVDITAVGAGLFVKVVNKTTASGDIARFPTGDLDLIFE